MSHLALFVVCITASSAAFNNLHNLIAVYFTSNKWHQSVISRFELWSVTAFVHICNWYVLQNISKIIIHFLFNKPAACLGVIVFDKFTKKKKTFIFLLSYKKSKSNTFTYCLHSNIMLHTLILFPNSEHKFVNWVRRLLVSRCYKSRHWLNSAVIALAS